MATFSGTFVPIDRPGATTPPFEGPGSLEVGAGVVLAGGRDRPWISRGVGCAGATVALVIGLALAILVMEFAWDFTRVRRGTSLIAMVCLALMLGGWGVGTKLVDLVLGRRNLRATIPPEALQGAQVQGRHAVLSWRVGGRDHLAFFVPTAATPEQVVAAVSTVRAPT